MNEFYIGLFLGIGLVLIVEWLYYLKYLGQEKKFKQKEEVMMKRLDAYFEKQK